MHHPVDVGLIGRRLGTTVPFHIVIRTILGLGIPDIGADVDEPTRSIPVDERSTKIGGLLEKFQPHITARMPCLPYPKPVFPTKFIALVMIAQRA